MATTYLDQPVGHFLDALASREPAPGGGAVAAMAAAMAAALTAMAARFSEGRIPGAQDVVATAEALRERVAPLAQRDAEAYSQVGDAYRLPRDGDPGGREERITAALRGAAEVPAEITEIAAEIAAAAARLAREGNPNLSGDAVTAVLLAEASAHSAARLVEINVRAGNLETQLLEGARRGARTAADYRRQVTGVTD